MSSLGETMGRWGGLCLRGAESWVWSNEDIRNRRMKENSWSLSQDQWETIIDLWDMCSLRKSLGLLYGHWEKERDRKANGKVPELIWLLICGEEEVGEEAESWRHSGVIYWCWQPRKGHEFREREILNLDLAMMEFTCWWESSAALVSAQLSRKVESEMQK